jgi:hypothetical protein
MLISNLHGLELVLCVWCCSDRIWTRLVGPAIRLDQA